MEHIIDVKNKYLGRVATEIAEILQGKKHPVYDPKNEGTDRVVVKNVVGIKVSGRKTKQKIYYRHTGYMGHLKTLSYEQMKEKDSALALRHAVRGMLPKNFLRDRRMKRLIIER
ncbi:MAG: 50S ribosomal protein L13 [Candidatus Harrisonbacteria bacterium RIFCSPLOWO2_01_FULL_40_28]|uniref:Large ribosomal subunit protein uL13 n=1 Tax=Candidatus Harrisonbacteria bacterium RIFCSPLOWO2_01_FULL_40_28 TaxID=1798406 RepID=A0A1G1ZK43_9BACT|nr:MAG: 50S ribosomal protein L13 [Candidatus Harrisonbacteria bacterium RIFCSPLOWO2_01_FULL_40_28]